MAHSLPYVHVDSTLRALAGQAEGFGRFSIGGLQGSLYHVTTLADDEPGSLRDGCRRKEPLWIVFEFSGTIHLSSYLSASSYKIIDGRGQQIKLTGKGLRLKECEHVIVCNLEFEGGRGPDVDGIQIKPNSKHIWIDRCSLRDYDDGLIDITRGSTDITHDKTMLIGADPSHIGDRCIRITIHHCFFDGTRQHHPRVRYGKIYSQCNIYEAGQKKVALKYLHERMKKKNVYFACSLKSYFGSHVCHSLRLRSYKLSSIYLLLIFEPLMQWHVVIETVDVLVIQAADKDDACTGCIRSEGDFISGTQAGLMTENVMSDVFHPSEYYLTWTVQPATEALKHVVKHCTGWQSVPRPAEAAS
ncbi:hypothetical protein F3Y22_tig00110053pilonHSYRG00051 [Hibiscus syriacus]|uniref:Pectate lyase n=1 Tax=Hibiscus syriacus TaxID=106335 RepID=A0A6A3BLU2_HIBSY|nr:hypothetical protein F3Y22_tig00110053pilonHSYRG00051 [Hibiscus syriacus]